jgi:hypothetical protein
MQFKTLDEMIGQAQDYDSRKTDFNDGYKPQFSSGKVVLWHPQVQQNPPVGPFDISDHALDQLCKRLGPITFGKGSNKMLPRDAFRAWLDNPLFAQFASQLLSANIDGADKSWFTRTYENGVRAILSDRYAAVQNSLLLARVQDALGLLSESAGKPVVPELFRSFITPDDLHLRFRIKGGDILPPGESGPYGLGIMIKNDEIGLSRIKASPVIWRGTCDNSAMYTDSEYAVNMTHIGDGQMLTEQVALAIGHSIKVGGELLTRFLNMRRIVLPNIFETISKIAEVEEWSVEVTDAVRLGTEGESNMYGLMNGVTFAAQHVFANNPNEMMAMESLAGSWLNAPPKYAMPAESLLTLRAVPVPHFQ